MGFPGKQAEADDDGECAVVCGGGNGFRGTTKGKASAVPNHDMGDLG